MQRRKGEFQILEIIDSEMGGMVESCSSSCLPRNKQQVRNVKRNLSASTTTDEVSTLLARCKVETEGFVCCIQAAPEPACVLATDFQLDQLVINCTTDEHSVAIPIIFKSKKFVRKRSEDHPIYMCPILIRHRMNYAS